MCRSHAVLVLVAAAVLTAPATAAAAPSTYDGELSVHHSDDFHNDRSTTRYRLVQNGRRRALAPSGATRIPSGARVVVTGTRRGGRIVGTVRPAPGVARPAAARTGVWRVAVLLVNFTAAPVQPWTPAAVSQTVFDAESSTAAYYGEQSWGQVAVTGDVLGWYTIDGPNTTCNVELWAHQARAAATSAGVNLSAYDSVAYALPQQSACGWAGLAELPGRQIWLNGDVSARILSHELGHNMGVHHASSLTCTAGGVPVAISSTCSSNEYGDPFDVMGSRSRRMGGWHLQQLAYMTAANVQTVSADGTYALRSTVSQSAETQVIRIARSPVKSPREYYYVDQRGAGGAFDAFGASDPAINGVTIRIGNDPNVVRQSQLIDTTPGSSGGFSDAPLGVGRTFSDGKVNITLMSLAGGVASVQVSFGPAPPDVLAPSAPSAPRITNNGGAFDLAWDEASDNVGVAGYRVKRDGQAIATVAAPSYHDAAVTQGVTYSYVVEAFDAAGNATAGASTTAALTPPPAPAFVDPDPPHADTTAPSVAFRSPGRGAKLRRRAVVKTVARDSGGVAGMELWVDDKRRAVSGTGKLDWTWALRGVRAGKHRLKVVARDDSGNAASASLAVRVVG